MTELSTILNFYYTVGQIKDFLSRSLNSDIGDLNRVVRNLFSSQLDSILVREKDRATLFVTVRKDQIIEVFEVRRLRR